MEPFPPLRRLIFIRPLTIRSWSELEDVAMNSIIYLVGLVVVVMFILSFLGLH